MLEEIPKVIVGKTVKEVKWNILTDDELIDELTIIFNDDTELSVIAHGFCEYHLPYLNVVTNNNLVSGRKNYDDIL